LLPGLSKNDTVRFQLEKEGKWNPGKDSYQDEHSPNSFHVRTPASSISVRTKSYLRRWSEVELPEVTSPEPAMTGNDVIGSHMTGSGIHTTGSDRMHMRNRFPRFFLTIVVVQNVPLRMTGGSMVTGCDVIKRHVTPKVLHWKGARMRNQKLRNIRPSGAFSPVQFPVIFLPCFPYHFTIQLIFLPYFLIHFTMQLIFLPYFPYLFIIQLTFLLYFPNCFTIQLTFLP
jgi:hypothetical protein